MSQQLAFDLSRNEMSLCHTERRINRDVYFGVEAMTDPSRSDVADA